jgi:hypothetical protein
MLGNLAEMILCLTVMRGIGRKGAKERCVREDLKQIGGARCEENKLQYAGIQKEIGKLRCEKLMLLG